MIYSLASFYNNNSMPSKAKTQRKSNRRPSLPASSPKLPSDNLRSNSAQSCNSQSLPLSLLCVHANMSKSHNRKNDKRKSFAFGTFASSKTVDSSTTTTHHSNMPIASTSPSKCKRKTRRTTQQPTWHPKMSCYAHSVQQPPSYVESKPTQDLPTTPPSLPYGGVTALTTSRQSRSQMRCEMPSRQLGRTTSTLQQTRSAHTPSSRGQPWQCSLVDAQFF